MPTMRWGKFKGRDLRDVDTDYLEFILESAERTVVEVGDELRRRREVELADLSWLQRIIEVGYRELAKRHHPDLGGSDEDMKGINNAAEALRGMVRNN